MEEKEVLESESNPCQALEEEVRILAQVQGN